jgi:hypothetical protein
VSAFDSIDDLLTHGPGAPNPALTVTRRATGSYSDAGAYVPNTSPSTFSLSAVVMPAYNLNRVIGGADLKAALDNQKVTDVRQLFTRTELKTRQTGFDPDVVALEGAAWTVVRVERWDGDGDVAYHVVITKQTGGAA